MRPVVVLRAWAAGVAMQLGQLEEALRVWQAASAPSGGSVPRELQGLCAEAGWRRLSPRAASSACAAARGGGALVLQIRPSRASIQTPGIKAARALGLRARGSGYNQVGVVGLRAPGGDEGFGSTAVWLRGGQNKAFSLADVHRSCLGGAVRERLESVVRVVQEALDKTVAQDLLLDGLLADGGPGELCAGSDAAGQGRQWEGEAESDGTDDPPQPASSLGRRGRRALLKAARSGSLQPGDSEAPCEPRLFMQLPYKPALELLSSWRAESFDAKQTVESLEAVAAARRAGARFVLDAPESEHSVAACLRTLECFGVPACDVTRSGAWAPSGPLRSGSGAEKFVQRRQWPSPASCAAALSAEGYRILVLDQLRPDVPGLAAVELPAGGRWAVVVADAESRVSGEFLAAASAVARVGGAGRGVEVVGDAMRASTQLGAALATLEARGALGGSYSEDCRPKWTPQALPRRRAP